MQLCSQWVGRATDRGQMGGLVLCSTPPRKDARQGPRLLHADLFVRVDRGLYGSLRGTGGQHHSIRRVRAGCPLGRAAKVGRTPESPGPATEVLECLLERPGEIVTREALRQRLWPGDTFVDFEQGVNAAVKRLRETLADSAESPRFVETLPRRGYRFIAPVRRDDRDRPGLAPSPPDQLASLAGKQSPPAIVRTPPAGARRWRHGLVAAGAIAFVLLTLAVWRRRASPETPVAPLRLVSLTTLTGSEYGPTFSPDGREVAFAWDGEQQDNSDIYVKLVGSSEVRRLTTHAAVDSAPQWSPDGKWIAYARTESPTSARSG